MTDATIEGFRQIAETMQNAPSNWQWVGKWESQRHFGITEARAKELEARHGGIASPLPVVPPFVDVCRETVLGDPETAQRLSFSVRVF